MFKFFFVSKPSAVHSYTNATIKALMCYRLIGRWSKIQATRYADGRWLKGEYNG